MPGHIRPAADAQRLNLLIEADMPDPINPRRCAEALLERILRPHPGLTPEEVFAEASTIGFDFDIPPERLELLLRKLKAERSGDAP